MPTSLQTAILSGLRNPYPGATLALDFVGAATNGAQYYSNAGVTTNLVSSLPGFSYSRTGTEYAQTSSGLLVPFASGVPAVTGLGLQVWEARTNLCLWSQDISNAAWTKTDITVGAAVAAPDGTATAALVTTGSAGTDTLTTTAATITASSTNTISIRLKKSATQWLRLVFADSTGTDGFNQWVDLTNGVLGTSTVRGAGTKTAATLTTLANGFYQVNLTGVASTRTSLALSIVSALADGSTTRVNGATYYPWGCMIEGGAAFAGPYIPTTTASATRGAASASVGGLSTPKSFAVRFNYAALKASGAARVLDISDTGINNRVSVFWNGTNLGLDVVAGGSTTASLNLGAITAGTDYVLAARVAAGDVAASLSGGSIVTGAPASVPTTTTLNVGADFGAGSQMDGLVKRLATYPTGLANAQLQGLGSSF